MYRFRNHSAKGNSTRVWMSLLAGAGLMYLLDPATGRRRRAMIRDKVVRAGHVVGKTAGQTARDWSNRLKGAAAKARRAPQALTDDALAGRIRARLGKLVKDPGAVEVSVDQGDVELLGTLPALEAERLVQAVGRLRGVRNVQNHIEIAAGGADSVS